MFAQWMIQLNIVGSIDERYVHYITRFILFDLYCLIISRPSLLWEAQPALSDGHLSHGEENRRREQSTFKLHRFMDWKMKTTLLSINYGTIRFSSEENVAIFAWWRCVQGHYNHKTHIHTLDLTREIKCKHHQFFRMLYESKIASDIYHFFVTICIAWLFSHCFQGLRIHYMSTIALANATSYRPVWLKSHTFIWKKLQLFFDHMLQSARWSPAYDFIQ